MKFVRNYQLKPDMVLARDLHLFDSDTNKVLLLRKGVKLARAHISKLMAIGISGAFIRDGVGDDFELRTVLKEDDKIKALLEIKDVFDNSLSGNAKVTDFEVQKVQDVANSLVDTILTNDGVRIGIGDLKNYDDYTYFHSLSVAVVSIAIGTELKLPPEQLRKLGLAALLHDIGKTNIPKEILNKPGVLTQEEFEIIKKHPKYGADRLRESMLVDDDIILAVECHHEKWSGNGYPYKLSGNVIPLFARIIAVADVYDALTSNRPYHEPNQPNDAFEYIMGSAHIDFDRDVVDAFLRKIEPYPIGSVIRLSNGEVGIVINTFDELPLRPTVKIIKTGAVYDLQDVVRYRNLTILGLYAEYETHVVNG